MTKTDRILTRKEGRVGYLTFNNPDRHNAMSLAMWNTTAATMDAFAKDPDIRAVVLTGAGNKAFISGADVSRFENERSSKEAIVEYGLAVERANIAVYQFPKPTVAMIQGYCLGGGLGLAVCCDLRIAADNSRFAVPAAKLGLGYEYPGLKRLADLVGISFAKEIFYTARQFDIEEARTMGLVNRVVPAAELEAYVKKYVETIANNAPLTLRAVKFALGEAVKDESKRDLARCSELVRACFTSNDYLEGPKAFLEKRKPVFTGT